MMEFAEEKTYKSRTHMIDHHVTYSIKVLSYTDKTKTDDWWEVYRTVHGNMVNRSRKELVGVGDSFNHAKFLAEKDFDEWLAKDGTGE